MCTAVFGSRRECREGRLESLDQVDSVVFRWVTAAQVGTYGHVWAWLVQSMLRDRAYFDPVVNVDLSFVLCQLSMCSGPVWCGDAFSQPVSNPASMLPASQRAGTLSLEDGAA